MKKRIAILSLVALFYSVVALTAQTAPAAKPASKTEAPAKTCCKGKTDAECKKLTPAQKATCAKDSAKTGGKCCSKK